MIDEKKLILHLNDWMLQESFLRYMTNPADTIAECIKAVEEQPKIGGWIPCSERLPEIESTVLLSLRSLDVSVGFRANTDGYFYTEGEGYVLYENVLAWQPLPEEYHG